VRRNYLLARQILECPTRVPVGHSFYSRVLGATPYWLITSAAEGEQLLTKLVSVNALLPELAQAMT